MKLTLAIALALSLQAGAVFAHAALVSEAPADGATVAAPAALTLTFAEAITLKFSGIKLMGPEMKEIATGEASLSPDGVTLTVPAKETLAPGTYMVEWHNLSDDGHKAHGTYSFTVK
jgi:hypothetical protein